MPVLIISQFYAPEPCAAANRVVALAHALADRGHDVTVLTAMPNFPARKIDEAYKGKLFVAEMQGRIRVERVWTLVHAGRLALWLSVAIGIMLRVLVSRRYDAVVVSSPPITLALPALVAKIRHRAMLVADIRDVFPDLPIQMGEWKRGGPMATAVSAVADTLYHFARLVVSVTPAARAEIVARGVDDHKLVLAPNGFDAVVCAPTNPYTRPPNSFVVAYVGNMGLASGLDVVIDAAACLRDDPRFRFVLIGAGADEAHLIHRIASEGVTNVDMCGVLPRSEALRVLADADAAIVPLRTAIQDSLPTKLFDALYVGCPVLLSANGEAKRVLLESGGGIAVPPSDGPALAAAIRELAANPEDKQRYGERGQTYVRARWDRARIMRELAEQIDSALRRSVARGRRPDLAAANEPDRR